MRPSRSSAPESLVQALWRGPQKAFKTMPSLVVMKPSLKKCRIAVIRGGDNREREISLQTGEAVEKALRSRGHEVFGMDVDDRLFSFLQKKEVDAAFIALHGKGGEDGTIQGFLEIVGIPYTGSRVLASALAMDKLLAKKIFECHDIPTPKWHEISKPNGKSAISLPFELPVVVKPVGSGSTLGVTIVREQAKYVEALKTAFREDNRVFVEPYIDGKELTVGVLGNTNPVPLPVMQVEPPSGGFYDYENKYTAGKSRHLVPAPIDPNVYKKAQEYALAAHQALGCRNFSRADMRLDGDNRLYVLEVNTIPGLTPVSLFPDLVRAAGISFEDMVELLVQWAVEPSTRQNEWN